MKNGNIKSAGYGSKNKINVNSRFLFLDDYRHPFDTYFYTQQTMYLNGKWVIVRNYNEFTRWILKNGLPAFISFDHDLAEEHYTHQEYSDDYRMSEGNNEKRVFKEKTGYDCAKWLIDYCTENNLKCPDYYCHSLNPIGKEKILGLLSQLKI